MKQPIRFVRIIGCLVIVLLLLTPASYADTPAPIDDWMETIEESYLNRAYIDMDGAYLGQCVDLAFFYAADIFDHVGFRQTIGLGNANQLFWSASDDYFEAIPYQGQPPQVGDIVSWDHYANGHVGIVFEVTEDRFFIYEQNSNMMGTAPVTIREIVAPDYGLPYMSYQPIGYLRPILETEPVEPTPAPISVIDVQH
ncbi:MAG: CHAP domain-containing protein [Tissierellia bacterium]|nr:CHAP domain-containing protein [Tissierellia bacterium]